MASKDNLRDQDGCHNCRFVFAMHEYDDPDTYFCNIDGDRPVCPSPLLGEYLRETEEASYREERKLRRAAEDAWNEWVGFGSRGHQREGWKICDKWEKQDD